MSAGKGVSLNPLQSVEDALNGLCNEQALQFKALEMIHGVPGTEGREQEIAHIGEVKAEEDKEHGLVEFPFPPPEF